jgi:uncharacterized protein (DUF488 family)
MSQILYTIGHSNRPLDEFLKMLDAFKIKQVIDVRYIPKSRHVPWSSQNSLAATLKAKKILYTHMPELGGRRHPKKNSVNDGWENEGFRGYADYMQTPEFIQALDKLNEDIKLYNSAIMCAEALPWRCHRSLISDAEVIRNIKVLHIMSSTTTKEHELTDFAVVNKRKKPPQIIYPGKNQSFDI